MKGVATTALHTTCRACTCEDGEVSEIRTKTNRHNYNLYGKSAAGVLDASYLVMKGVTTDPGSAAQFIFQHMARGTLPNPRAAHAP